MKVIKKYVKLLNQNCLEAQANYLNDILNKNVEFKFKNVLNIIFKFHLVNKKILFVGTPLQLNKQLKKLFKKAHHLILPEKIWFNGVLTNSKSIFRFLFKKCLKNNIIKWNHV